MQWIPKQTTGLTTIDLFCGFGGWSTAAGYCGVEVKSALNHWDCAIDVHSHNHPETAHYLVDVRQTHPRNYPTTRMFLGSPACTDFSQARGVTEDLRKAGQYSLMSDKEIEMAVAISQKRATMWDVIRFAEYHKYEVGLIENVVEVHKWSMFGEWCRELTKLGYEYKMMYFNSMFFHSLNGVTHSPPAPQSRDRWYCAFWQTGMPAPNLEFKPLSPCPNCGNVRAVQIWKNPAKRWGKYNQQYYYGCPNCVERHRGKLRTLPVVPYYYAAINAINFDIPIMKVGDPKRKQQISPKTKARIKAGLEKYGPHAQLHNNNRDPRTKEYIYRSALLHPLYTQVASSAPKIAIPPILINTAWSGSNRTLPKNAAGEPMFTQMTGGTQGLAIPPLTFDGNGFDRGAQDSTESPLSTQTTREGTGVAMIMDLARVGRTKPIEAPLPTQTTKETQSVILPPYLVELHNNGEALAATGHPLNTATAGGIKSGVALDEAFLVELYGQGGVRDLQDVLSTFTTREKAGIALTTYNGTSIITGPEDALPTVTTKARHGMAMWEDATEVTDEMVNDMYYRTLRGKHIKPGAGPNGTNLVYSEIRTGQGFPQEYNILGSKGEKRSGADIVRGFGGAITPGVGEWAVPALTAIMK